MRRKNGNNSGTAAVTAVTAAAVAVTAVTAVAVAAVAMFLQRIAVSADISYLFLRAKPFAYCRHNFS